MKTARFPIGLVFQHYRYAKAKERTPYTIQDVYTTTDSKGNVVKIGYLVTHEFMGQAISELMVDTTIARSLTNEQLQEYL